MLPERSWLLGVRVTSNTTTCYRQREECSEWSMQFWCEGYTSPSSLAGGKASENPTPMGHDLRKRRRWPSVPVEVGPTNPDGSRLKLQARASSDANVSARGIRSTSTTSCPTSAFGRSMRAASWKSGQVGSARGLACRSPACSGGS